MQNTNPQAQALNEKLKEISPTCYALLSQKGLKSFFPKKGILSQTADAKGKKYDATIGVANEEDGSIMYLKSVQQNLNLDPKDTYAYAPSYGRKDLREKWQNMILSKNPSLQQLQSEAQEMPISMPLVTNALTHAISIIGQVFLNPGDQVISPDLYWGNYNLILGNGCDATLTTFKTFKNNKFNIEGLKEKLNEPGDKKIVILNFPNNPTGYTPLNEEVNDIVEALKNTAENGKNIIAIIDDAYFGLVYEEGVFTESIFSALANAHENILAIKADGATKEDYVWGFRVGFITYGIKGGNEEIYKILEEKTAGAVRGNISNVSNLAQSLLLKAYESPDYNNEKQEKFEILKKRYQKVKEVLKTHPEYKDHFAQIPYNSGYFMCVELNKLDAEEMRQHLLKKYETGIIAIGDNVIRVAYSGLPLNLIEELFENIYNACRDLSS
ncbi:aminotransferase class I/II-fold pyridoxal phosphate-dependent enzyme [Patescibacteria group bacterium]|nr:aminotransferase class I/II-fold pyridoxal phosphate-dependent enzyme [Patescibacteria group bacterium]